MFTTAVLMQSIACPHCQLNQFPSKTGECLRCHKPTRISYFALDVPRYAAARSAVSVNQIRPLMGRVLRIMRSRRGLNQELLSRSSRVSRGQVSRFDSGAACPSLSSLLRIAATLGIDQLVIQTRDTNQIS